MVGRLFGSGKSAEKPAETGGKSAGGKPPIPPGGFSAAAGTPLENPQWIGGHLKTGNDMTEKLAPTGAIASSADIEGVDAAAVDRRGSLKDKQEMKITPDDIGRYADMLVQHLAVMVRRQYEIGGEIGATTLGVIDPKNLLPRGRSWCDDPELALRYLSIREIGWELFAIGGTDLMRKVHDEIYERSGVYGVCIERRWDGIGVGADMWRT